MSRRWRALSFDVGGTLLELDAAMLARRLGERGVTVDADVIDASWETAWHAHETRVAAGARHPWRELMTALLAAAGAPVERIAELVEWLWHEQPAHNLWRRPVPGMKELVAELHGRGVPMAILSNSEGRIAALLEELGWAHYFVAFADSGVLGVAKPDPAIFAWTVARLGVPAAEVAHIGDSREAYIAGAVGAGLGAIWFGPGARDDADPAIDVARDAAGLRALLDERLDTPPAGARADG